MSKRTYDTAPCEQLCVRYILPSGKWQAVRVYPVTIHNAEDLAQATLDELLNAGKQAEIYRTTPVL